MSSSSDSDSEGFCHTRSSFQNYGCLPLSVVKGRGVLELEHGVPVLPPSPNWFTSQAMDSRAEDRLLVTAAFKTIVVYCVQLGSKLPLVLKSFSHAGGKVLHVSLFPDASNSKHQGSLLATGEYGTVTVYSADTGAVLLQHSQHKGSTIGGVCWSILSTGEVYAVSVDKAGAMVVWSITDNLARVHTIQPNQQHRHANQQPTTPHLTLVEAVPGGDGRVVMVADKVVLVVDTKNGAILTQLRGHDHPVYCLRWYPLQGSPLAPPSRGNTRAQGLLDSTSRDSGRGSRSDNWRSGGEGDQQAEPAAPSPPPPADGAVPAGGAPGGLFFASSDTGRNILVWDLAAERYVAKTTVAGPQYNKKGGAGGRYAGRPTAQHVALAWRGAQLMSNTTSGEVLAISMWGSLKDGSLKDGSSPHRSPKQDTDPEATNGTVGTETSNAAVNGCAGNMTGGSSTKTVHREHSRVVYNIEVFGSTVLSYSHDRSLVGYCLDTNKVLFTLPTLGAVVNTMSFCPHDASWLTLGLQENSIKTVNLHSTPPFRTKTYYNGIKGKVLSLLWNPSVEGQILYGTGDGQVGLVDVNTGRVTAFSYFHQKPVYKVQWAPAVLSKQFPELGSSLCAFSFGDREIVMRDPKAPMADPIKLTKVHSSLPTDISEFSFTYDSKFIAIGCQSGSVSVLRSSDLKELVKMVFVHKTIQHLLWKPKKKNDSIQSNETDGDKPEEYILAISSSDSKICIIDLTTILKDQIEKASAVEEGSTVEAEEANPIKTFEPLIITSCDRELAGHGSRVVWLSYSPHNPDLLASASYDQTCQVWDTSSGEGIGNYRGHITRVFRVEFSPNEAGLVFSFGDDSSVHSWRITHLKHKSPPQKGSKSLDQKLKPISNDQLNDESSKETLPANTAAASRQKVVVDTTSSDSSGAAGRRVPVYKSLFPLLHNATCHKRCFSLLSILCMDKDKCLAEANKKQDKDQVLEDLLGGEGDQLEESDNSGAHVKQSTSAAASHYPQVLANHGAALLEASQSAPPVEDIQSFLEFYGSPAQLSAAITKQITDHDSNGRSSSSFVLHAFQGTLERHVRQAIAAKTLTAHLVAQAAQVSPQLVEVASEAYAYQLADSGDPLLASTYLLNAWKVNEAIELLQKHKLYREALALAKCRLPYNTDLHTAITRTFAGTAVYEGNYDLAAALYASIGDRVMAANTLCRRGDPSSLVVAGLLYQSDGHTLQRGTFLEALKVAAARGQWEKIPVVLKAMPEYKWFETVVIAQRVMAMLEASVVVGGGVEAAAKCLVATEDGERVAPLSLITKLWAKEGHTVDGYSAVRAELTAHLSTSQQPLTLKQFWFLVSVEVSKLLLLPCNDPAALDHLAAVLQLVLDWGWADQAYVVTHMLLSAGPYDSSSMWFPFLEREDRPQPVQLLSRLYHVSELHARPALHSGTPAQRPAKEAVSEDRTAERATAVQGNSTQSSDKMDDVPNSKSLLKESDQIIEKLDDLTIKDAIESVTKDGASVESASNDAKAPAVITEKCVAIVRALIESLSKDSPVITSANLYKIDMFKDPRAAIIKSLVAIDAAGIISKSTVSDLKMLL